jgi:CDP-glucose 4,6-dehydratase
MPIQFKKSKILVTGATGLVGGHMVERLLELGAVVSVAQRSLNPESYLVKTGLAEKVTVLRCDITSLEEVKKLLNDADPEHIFHLAGQLRVPSVYETLSTNIIGTMNMLEAVRQKGTVKGLFMASSHRAYVGKNVSPEVLSKLPKNIYDLSKTVQELVIQGFIEQYDLPVVVGRFGNTFGPGDTLERVIPVIMKKIITGDTFEIQGSGDVQKNYIYVGDVVSGYMALAEHFESVVKKSVNFVTPFNFSASALAEEISKTVGKKLDYKIMGDIAAEIPLVIPEGVDAESLGWKPGEDFHSMIRKTYEWYRT